MDRIKMKARLSRPTTLADRQVLVLGLARQGTALVRFLVGEGAQVLASDLRDEQALREILASLEGVPVRYVLGEHPVSLLDGIDLVCLSGGVPTDAPIVVEAQRRGIPLSNDAQLFLERCPAPLVGITGSSGKTTTTALVGRMMHRGRFRTWVGGNIGRPLVDQLWDIKPDDRVALELSSFQLELVTVSPEVAAVLNVTPNHLDRHKTMAAYVAAKRKILAFQGAEDVALLSMDDPGAWALASDVRGRLAFFTERDVGGGEEPAGDGGMASGAYLRDEVVTVCLAGREHAICRVDEIKLLGRHNVLNLLAACVLAGLVGVPPHAMREVATTFTGVAHRLQLVRVRKGVRFYDDSIATAPERTAAALRVFEDPIILLAGGRDKALPWEEMARLAVQRARHVVAFGEAAGLVERVITEAKREVQGGRLEDITRVGSLEEAVTTAVEVAQAGDVVLLAPGGTSFDAFQDFEERGDRFKALVRAL
jgi:UDP-N-acetylmuramoylalanine--D-glutamate ligase